MESKNLFEPEPIYFWKAPTIRKFTLFIKAKKKIHNYVNLVACELNTEAIFRNGRI